MVISKSTNIPILRPGLRDNFLIRRLLTKKKFTNLFMTDTTWEPVNSKQNRMLKPSRKMQKSQQRSKPKRLHLSLFLTA